MQTVLFQDLERIGYQEAWDYQESLLKQNVAAKLARPSLPTENHLLFCEHPPVYTLGKSGRIENVLISDEDREQKGIGFFQTNRGGDITFHGPGQLVGYPILDLEHFGTDIGKYLRNLEEVIIRTMSDYGLHGQRSPGETGVWLDPELPGGERKICAIGVRCSRWITMHGFAFNMDTDLDYFQYIIPCGIEHKQVTSLARELGRTVDPQEVKDLVKHHFTEVFDVEFAESTIVNEAGTTSAARAEARSTPLIIPA